ncbi:MAG: alpha/beta fold hydrolase [Ilumatobacteraceae bacterium]
MAEISESDIDVNGVTLRVRQAGDPAHPTVVLCHGFPELAYSWRHQMMPLTDAGFHVVAPDQRGYGRSTAPREVAAYGIGDLGGDLIGLLEHFGKDDAVFVGHDWGALIVWDLARLQPQRVRAVVGVSVPFVQWPAPPTQLMKMLYGDRFFYILYFQQPGVAEAELDADAYDSMSRILWNAGGDGFAAARSGSGEPPPMEGTGFLTMMAEPPARPFMGPEGPWLTEADLQTYAEEFAHSGFFGPVSYYRNLDANFAVVNGLGPERVTMPTYFISGTLDVVSVMDPSGIERMQNLLPDFRGHTVLEGVGHWTQQEAPAAFNEALLGFLRSL